MEIAPIICTTLILWQSVVGLTVNKYYTEGSTVILKCKQNATNSNNSVNWSGPKDFVKYSIGQKINPQLNASKVLRLNVTGNHTIGEYNLQISNFQQQDQGYYQCQVTGSTYSKETIHLSVKVVLRDAFIAPSGQVVIESSQRKQFNCSASSLPLPSIVWHLDSKNISENLNATINVSVTSVYEYIGTKDDNGKNLYCTAESDGIKVQSVYAQLNVTYGPSTSQKIEPPNTSIEKRKGEDLAQIQCSADCNPYCQFQWIKGNGQVVVQGDTLSIQSLEKTDHGTYRCRAWNDIGETSINITLTINYGPEYINLLPNTSTYILQELTSLPGITCDTECRPSCWKYWVGPKNQIIQSDNLNIGNISRTQAGTYSCYANNSVSDLTSYNVVVIVTYGASVVSLETTARTHIFNQSQDVNMTCNVIGVPQPKIKWTFNGEEINDQENKTSYVFNAACEKTGNYTCSAENSLGDGKETKEIFVQCGPRISRDISTGSKVGVKDGEGLNITVTLTAFPQPDIHWSFKNSSVSVKNSFGSFEHTSYLYKPTVAADDFGIYSLLASNKMGSVMFDVMVGSERSPDPPVIIWARCTHLTMEVYWNASFDGGDKQSFIIKASKFSSTEPMYTKKIDYFGKNPLNATVNNLTPGTLFEVIVIALNGYGKTESEGIANCTSSGESDSSNIIAIAAGTGTGSALILLGVVFLVMFYLRQRLGFMKKKSDQEPVQSHEYKGDDSEGLKDNPMYISTESAVFNVHMAKADSIAEYSQGKKIKEMKLGCVYENADDFVKQDEQIYAKENGRHDNTLGFIPKKNKDGLVYADLDLKPLTAEGRVVIHGLANKNNYAIIDLSKKASPLPSDEEEIEENIEKKG